MYSIYAHKKGGTIIKIALSEDPENKFHKERGKDYTVKMEILYQTEDKTKAHVVKNQQLYIYKRTTDFKGHTMTKRNFAIACQDIEKWIADGSVVKYEEKIKMLKPRLNFNKYEFTEQEIRVIEKKIGEHTGAFCELNGKFAAFTFLEQNLDKIDFKPDLLPDNIRDMFDEEDMANMGKEAVKKSIKGKLKNYEDNMAFQLKKLLFWTDEEAVAAFFKKNNT